MRIIDTRKDYYDCVQRNGFDNTVVYLRKESEVFIHLRIKENHNITKDGDRLNKLFCGYFDSNIFNKCKYNMSKLIIGFCGKIYPCIKVSYVDETTLIRNTDFFHNGDKLFVPKPVSDYLYNIDQIDALVQKITPEKYLKHYQDNIRPKVLEFFKAATEFEKQDFAAKIFKDNKCPIFLIHERSNCFGYKIVLNCIIKDFQFYRVLVLMDLTNLVFVKIQLKSGKR